MKYVSIKIQLINEFGVCIKDVMVYLILIILFNYNDNTEL